MRVFDTSSGQKLQELRRGTDPAEIYHIAFDRSCAWLAVTSDKNTVHVFALREPSDRDAAGATAAPRVGDVIRLNLGTGATSEASPTAAAEAKNKGSWLNIAQVCSGTVFVPIFVVHAYLNMWLEWVWLLLGSCLSFWGLFVSTFPVVKDTWT